GLYLILRPPRDGDAKLAELAKPVSRVSQPGGAGKVNPPAKVNPPVKLLSFDNWLQDFEQAKLQAAEEKKDILILFDGSDWCGYSMRLAFDALLKPDFKQATQNFVLVFIDFPRNPLGILKVQNPARNQRLMEEFGIQGFPTMVLTDSKGQPYAAE